MTSILFQRNLRQSQNAAAACVACCCAWIIEMLEEFLQYIVRNAYIIVALQGTPLIESGKKAVRLITSNLLDVYALNKFGDFVLVMGRLFVASIAGFLCYELVGVSFQRSMLYFQHNFIIFRNLETSTTRSSPSLSV